MLGKLIKHELKITSRLFLPMYLCFAIVTLLLKCSFLFSGGPFSGGMVLYSTGDTNGLVSFIQGIMIFIYVVLIIGISLLTYFVIIKRFYTNMFGDEAYLMFTLPVKTRDLMNSKLISSFLWLLIMAPMIIGSFLILFAGTDAYYVFQDSASLIMEELHVLEISGFNIGLLLFEIILSSVIGMITSLLMCYLSITLGHHFVSEHRLIGSIGFYILLGMIQSGLESMAGIFSEDQISNILMSSNPAEIFNVLHVLLPVSILFTVALGILYYAATHFLLNRKLNLN